MVVRKRKKHEGFRGVRTYHGSHKLHKGAGGRGGRGNAGLRRHKKGWMLKNDPMHFGKHGFTRLPTLVRNLKTINLRELDLLVNKLVEKKLVENENGKIKVNLKKIGYDKLLGTGKITKPLIVEAKYFSKIAVQKLEKIGGKTVNI
ncbi:MAG: 50S ribosomal protein L15 [Candidatus Aenigmarchaeota archaeon]|nr:50S ribosomal protein L15 [Candidatus Aenigmarchaeota archaeon]